MAARGQAMTVEFHAWDTSANAPKTGDAANITLRWVKDGTSAALTTTTVTEVDSTNAKGVYKCDLSSTETDCLAGKLCGVSSTANIAIFGPSIFFDQLPTAAPGASGGVPTVDASNAVKVQSGTGANQISLSSGLVTVGTNNDKTGYTASTVSDKTGYALSAAGVTAVQSGLATAANQTTIAGYIDTEVAAIKAKTDNLPASPAATSDIPTVSDILTTQMTESYATDGSAPTVAQALLLIQQMLTEKAVASTTLTVKKIDGSTTAATFTLDDATAPTSITRAS